jgi:ribosomal protein S18 acetylase RimI-like enzyme
VENLKIRKAQVCQAEQGGKLIMDTLYGFGTYMTGLGSYERGLKAMSDFFRLPGNRCSYEFSYFASIDDEIAGLLLTFPGTMFKKLCRKMVMQIPKVYSLSEIGEFIRRTIILKDEEEVSKDELYVAHLSVDEKFRRKGIGGELLNFAENKAREAGLKKLSLMAEQENTNAINLYRKFGFSVIKTYDHPHQIPLTGSPGYVRMIKDLCEQE